MTVEHEIEQIRAGIRAGRYSNEASVSQGIVLRLLQALGWPCFDTDAVWPEYSLSGRRVDYALCSPRGKPIAIIEVKQIGQSDGAERQLFEYAFHEGVPMAILTDGREWNFFLPGEQGDYGERRVYKLDIVERDIKQCTERLDRYLLFSAVSSGSAIQAARDDYRNVSKRRQMESALPKAWSQIIADEDEMLLEIVADRVESLCGFKPDPDMVAAFLKQFGSGSVPATQARFTSSAVVRPVSPNAATILPAVELSPMVSNSRSIFEPRPAAGATQRQGFQLSGKWYPARNAIDALRQIFDLFIERDPTFAERFAGLPKHGRIRRYLAREPNELYPNRPDLVRECSLKLGTGWWMGTNHSKQTIAQIISMACDVAGVAYGREMIIALGD